ncbi:MAG: hypothetical protein KDB14_12920 [Planctomycetales bacterium]|nr:hypothetical protein [Planctomycetales bacterium]
MRSVHCFLAVAAAMCVVSAASAQLPAGIKLNPGERLISINGQPVGNGGVTAATYAAPAGASSVAQVGYQAPATDGAAANIVGQLTQTGLPFSHSPGATALDKANYERQRNGQRALIPDPSLQQLALQKATIAAQRGYKNHIGGSLGGASCEGVGHTNGRFLTCCLDKAGTYGGAAMVQGRDGWYCCLLVR